MTAKGDVFSVDLRYVHEKADLRASCLLAELPANCAQTTLNEVRGTVAYSWRNKVTATLSPFATSGSANGFRYGGPHLSPNSNGVLAELDYTPWGDGSSPLGPLFAVHVGAQATLYGKFDGARHNYDGAGANASDNDALRVFTWVAF
jgi:hypothetical protein